MAKRKHKKVDKNKKTRVKPSVPIVETARQLSHRTYWVIAIAIGLIGAALYAPSYRYGFVYDDDAVIKDNRFVKAGTEGLDEIWSTSYFKGLNPRMNVNAFRPVPLTTLALEVALFDNKPLTAKQQLEWTPNASIYHISNLFYYALTGIFLFIFLARLLRGYHYFIPVAIALLFVVHPIHLEVVANIKSRDTILGFLNFSLAAWLLLKAIDQRKHGLLLPSLLFFGLGLLSKEEVITFLAVIPAMLWVFRPHLDWKKIGLYTLSFVGVAAVILLWRHSVIGADYIKMKPLDNSLIGAQQAGLLYSSRSLAWWHYFSMSLFPHPLISDYSMQTLPNVNWSDWRAIAAVPVYSLLVIAAAVGVWRRKLYGFGAFYYLATFSVFSSLIVWNFSIYNDRFLYSPVLGIIMLLMAGLTVWLTTSDESGQPLTNFGSFAQRNIAPLAIMALLVGVSVLKVSNHLPLWENRYVLFAHDMQQAPTNARMLKNHGGSLARQAMAAPKGEEQRALAQEGIEVLNRALEIYPRIATGWTHLGNCHFMLNEFEAAEKAYRKTLQIDSRNHFATINLANILCRKGNTDEAIAILRNLPPNSLSAADREVIDYCERKASR